ncbi:MAG: NADH-quinone oxidoreductase subunit N, partial [Pseudomonadota bacterium]
MNNFSNDLLAAAPEVALAIGAMVLLMVGVFVGGSEERKGRVVLPMALAVLLAVGFVVPRFDGAESAFNGLFITDDFS